MKKMHKKHHIKKTLHIEKKYIAAILAVLIAAGSLAFFIFRNRDGLDLTIGGMKIGEDEYLEAMQQEVYDTTQHFYAEYDAVVDSDFWEKDFGGEIPYKLLTERTIERLKQEKAVYGLAAEKGYIDSAGYDALLERFENENKIRADKIENGEPVYGLSEFTLELYMEYEKDSLQKKYCEDLDNEGMTLTDEEREEYYDKYKDALFVKDDDITLEFIRIRYELEELDEGIYQDLKTRMTDVYNKIDAEHTVKSLAEADAGLKPYLYEETILSGEYISKGKTLEDVIGYAAELKPGESTQVIDENGTLYLIQCTARTEYDYQPLEEVINNIDKELREQHYNAIIQERASGLEVDADMEKLYFFTEKNIKK